MTALDGDGTAQATIAEVGQPADGLQADYILRLFVAGDTAKTRGAIASLTRLCHEHLRGRYTYKAEIIDLLEQPELAAEAEILALPTLMRLSPLPLKRIIGDLSNMARVLTALGIRADPGESNIHKIGPSAPPPATASEAFVRNSRDSRLGSLAFHYRIE